MWNDYWTGLDVDGNFSSLRHLLSKTGLGLTCNDAHILSAEWAADSARLTNVVETAGTGLNVYAREFIPRHKGTRHVWNVDAPSFVPAQSFTKLNVFAQEFVPRPCDFVRENRMDSSSTVSVDVCVPKCNDPQVRICDWSHCSESPECGGPYRLGDRCRRADLSFDFNKDYLYSDHDCVANCDTQQQCCVDFDSDKCHAWLQANCVYVDNFNDHRVSLQGTADIINDSNYAVNNQSHIDSNNAFPVIDKGKCGVGNKEQQGVGRVHKYCNYSDMLKNNNFGQYDCLCDNTSIAPRCTYIPSHIKECVGFVQDRDNTAELPPPPLSLKWSRGNR